jgi:hypothetical protein
MFERPYSEMLAVAYRPRCVYPFAGDYQDWTLSMSHNAAGHAAANEQSESFASISSSHHNEIDFFESRSVDNLLADGICAA